MVSLAKRLQEEDTGITVNAVTPGFATTKSSGIAVHDEHTAEQGARILLPYAQLGPEHVATTGMLGPSDMHACMLTSGFPPQVNSSTLEVNMFGSVSMKLRL